MENGRLEIPVEFQLFTQVHKVIWDDDLCRKNGNFGESIPNTRKILLQTPEKENMPQTMAEETFFHELVHTILHVMGQVELTKDEPFVEIFSSLLYQALTTAKYGAK